jgi:hypothetical protein
MVRKLVASLFATTFLALSAASAWAQQASDYVVGSYAFGSRYEAPSASATTVSFVNSTDDDTTALTLPFTFTFFGTDYTSCNVCTNGFLAFSSTANTYTNTPLPSSIGAGIYPYWDDYYVVPPSAVQTWTTGSSPNRHFVISWEAVTSYSGTGGTYTVQIQLYEGVNTVIVSYTTPSGGSWPTSGYTTGIQAADGRYQIPAALGNGTDAGQPPSDFEFRLPSVNLGGRILYDRYVVDTSGVGNSSQQNLPLGRTRVEVRNAAGTTIGSALTDAQGNFTVTATGAQPSTFGTIHACSQNDVCTVTATAGGAPYAVTAGTCSFAQDASVGTLSLTESNDAGGAGRAPIHVAAAAQATYDWARARSADTIPTIEILYSTASPSVTSYTAKAGGTPATMRVSGASTNPDGWDADVIRKTYARHVLGAIAADPAPSSSYSSAFDSSSNAENAFAEGFGYYVNALMTQRGTYYDGVNATTTTSTDLESRTGLHSSKSGSVAAWVAEALYDTVDGANESYDSVDGTTAPDRVFQLVDAMATPATGAKLYDAWLYQGYDGPSITTDFIAHGLLPDDADEPNEDATQPTVLPQFGVSLSGRILNRYNEDWYRFTLPDPTNSLQVQVVYDRGVYATAVMILQLRDAAGATILGTGSPLDTGPISLVTGALPAGDYVIRVALEQGGPIGAYSLQAFAQLAFRSDRFPAWTVGRPYAVSLNVTGGIPPYGLTIPSQYNGPEGLVFDGEAALVSGVPSGPTTGLPQGGFKTYDFLLEAIDTATPRNKVSKLVSFTLNDIVRTRFGDFAAFAKDKPIDRSWPMTGGTPPYVGAVFDGTLPEGVTSVSGDVLKFRGAATTAGSTNFKLTIQDAAGYTTTVNGRSVTCVPLGDAPLAAGVSATGWYFDALKGTSVSLAIAPGKKLPVRTIRVVLLDGDGSSPLNPTVKPAKGGKATLSGFVAPATGRYFCVVASDDAGLATTLTVKPKFGAPKGGSGASPDAFGDDDALSVRVPALAGCALTFAAKPDKSGLAMGAPKLYDPAGAEVTLSAAEAVIKKGALTLKKTLPTSGDWTVVLSAAPGASGKFTYSFKTKQPAKVVYAVD